MTNEQINISIEEIIRPALHGNIYRPPREFCNDLNAMHEAEKVLTSEQVTSYVDSLESMNERWSTPAFGTAAQRAEAFLRTLEKWEE